MKLIPVLQALLIADHVYLDRNSNKRVIAGTFNEMHFVPKSHLSHADVPPGQTTTRRIEPDAGSPWLYVNLTEVRGKIPLTVRWVDLADNRVLLQMRFNVESADPLVNVEPVVALPRLPMARAGVHALELLCEDTPLGSLRIKVVEVERDVPESENAKEHDIE